jgi:hypothetical protein
MTIRKFQNEKIIIVSIFVAFVVALLVINISLSFTNQIPLLGCLPGREKVSFQGSSSGADKTITRCLKHSEVPTFNGCCLIQNSKNY